MDAFLPFQVEMPTTWTYYGAIPVHIDAESDNAIRSNHIINGSTIQIQYTDLQQYEPGSASITTALPVIQTNTDGEEVYTAGLEEQDFYIPCSGSAIASEVRMAGSGVTPTGSSTATANDNPITLCTPMPLHVSDPAGSYTSMGITPHPDSITYATHNLGM